MEPPGFQNGSWPVSREGGRRQGAKPLGYAAPGLWPAVGVVGTPPRKVLTFPEGNYEVFALCRRPTAGRSKIVLFSDLIKNRKNVAKWSPKATPNGAQNLKNLLKCRSEGLLKSKWWKKRKNVEFPTASNPLKRVKTHAGTPFSPFHPDT